MAVAVPVLLGALLPRAGPPRDELRGRLPALQVLYLHGNQLATLKAAGALAFLPALLRLTLHDNPLATHPNYRHFLVNSILSLRALDLHVISDEELIEGAHFPARFGALGDAAALPLFHQGARVAGAAEAALVRELESEIAALNASLHKDGRRYVLMAPGRWGSADDTKGIPVAWSDISSSGFIVETEVPAAAEVPLSQGSHFFQNIISFGLGYASVRGESEVANYSYWDSLPTSAASNGNKYARHVTLDEPLEIVVDGLSRRGVVMKPGNPFDVYVGQVDAFVEMAKGEYNSTA